MNNSSLRLPEKHLGQGINTSHTCPITNQTEHKDTATFFTFFQVQTKYMNHFRPSQTRLFKLSSLYSHYEEHRETASLTWLMKRLLRFSLTVKTKDATERLHACMAIPYGGQDLCVVLPSVHQPMYPVAPLPNTRIRDLRNADLNLVNRVYYTHLNYGTLTK